MDRKKFLQTAGLSAVIAGTAGFLVSDIRNLVRSDIKESVTNKTKFLTHEAEILFLASLAPSGHNTQPWAVKYIEPYNWIIANDRLRWLSAVDPTHRETILSIGAFLQNLLFAAGSYGYQVQFTILGHKTTDEDIVDVKLQRSVPGSDHRSSILQRRTIRSKYSRKILTDSDRRFLLEEDPSFIHYIPNNSQACQCLNENTLLANKKQSYDDKAEAELAQWIRFSNKAAAEHRDGLTPAGMELDGIPGWIVRNFYSRSTVMSKSFRNESIAKVKDQVVNSAGWLIVTSNGSSVTSLLEAGMRMERLFLKVRERGVAIHPMTQLLEESMNFDFKNELPGISAEVQFLLRTGYVTDYPQPVSLRRSVDSFVA